MYRKKLAVKVMVAIMAGSLLCSNVAMAAGVSASTTVNDERLVEENKEAASKEVTVNIKFYDEEGKTVAEDYQTVTVVEGEETVLKASELENRVINGVEYQVAEGAEDFKLTYSENLADRAYWAVPIEKVPEAASKEVTVNIKFYDEEGKTVAEDYQTVTVVEGEETVLKASELENRVINGVEYQVAEGAEDFKLTYSENLADRAYWAVPIEKVPEAASKEVTVNIKFYDEEGKTVAEDYKHVTVVEGKETVLKASELENRVIDGVEYQVAEGAEDFKLTYSENLADRAYWAVPIEKVPEVASKEVTVNIKFYDEEGKTVAEDYQTVTVVEGEETVLKASELENRVINGVEYQVAEGAEDFKLTYSENLADRAYWAVPIEKVPEAASKEVTVNIKFYDEEGKTVAEDYQTVTVVEGEETVLKASELENRVINGVEYQVAEGAEDFKLTYSENLADRAYWAVPIEKVPEAASKEVTVNIKFYDEEGKTVAEDYQTVTVVEGEETVLKASELENRVINGVEYQVAEGAEDFKLTYSENLADRAYWAVPIEKVPEAASKEVTVNIKFYDEEGKTVAEDYKHVTVVEGKETVLKASELENRVIDGVEYQVAEGAEDFKLTYSENLADKAYWAVPIEKVPEVTTKTIIVNYVNAENPDENVLTADLKVAKDATMVAGKELNNIPAGWELARDENFYYVIIEETNSITVPLKQKAVTPEEKEDNAVLHVVYVEGKAIIGRQDLTETGLVGEEKTFTAKDLVAPEGYEITSAFAGYSVAYGTEATVNVEVQTLNPIVPGQETADAKLTISYQYANTEVGTQVLPAVNGKKGESYTFTEENVELKVPAGYKFRKTFKFPATVVEFGEEKTLVLEVIKNVSENIGGGSGSGSSGGSSSSGKTTVVKDGQALVGGQWILDSVGWWYPFQDNTYAKGGWYYLEWQDRMDWYYFNAEGYLISGWYEENGNKYYLHELHDGTFGHMYLGWNKIGDQWYYFNDNADKGVYGALVEGVPVPSELANK